MAAESQSKTGQFSATKYLKIFTQPRETLQYSENIKEAGTGGCGSIDWHVLVSEMSYKHDTSIIDIR